MAAARWRRPAAGVVAGASAPGMPAAPHASPSSARVMPPPPTMRYSRRRLDFFERVYGLLASLPCRRCRCAGLRQDVGQRLHGGHPRLVAGCRLQRLPGLGARRAHRLRHLAELGVVRARLCAAAQFVRRVADVLARRLHSGGAHAQLQPETGGLSSCRCQGSRHRTRLAAAAAVSRGRPEDTLERMRPSGILIFHISSRNFIEIRLSSIK